MKLGIPSQTPTVSALSVKESAALTRAMTLTAKTAVHSPSSRTPHPSPVGISPL
jgi:hypothetical protein